MGTENKSIGSVLVTGGAGYIGSHACKVLAHAGYLPITLDDLSLGNREAVRWGPLVVGDIGDSHLVRKTIQSFNVSAVIHFAASAYVAESWANPKKYFHNNLVKTITLLDTVLDAGVRQFVFSSTCATYGIPQQDQIDESHPQNPINAYGESKLAVERVMQWYGQAYQLAWVALRYFNAAGSDPEGEIGESHEEETHLIPLAIKAALDSSKPISIFGAAFPTQDGTAVRDFVHVTDLAVAHKLALDYLARGGQSKAFNLGTGKGHSVREVIHAIEAVSGRTIAARQAPARGGDPPILVADSTRARQELGWACQFSDLNQIVSTAWSWSGREDTQLETQASLAAEV